MADDDIAAELVLLGDRFAEYRDGIEEGKSGSPGEWIIERIDELETERRRRIMGIDGDIGRRHPRI